MPGCNLLPWASPGYDFPGTGMPSNILANFFDAGSVPTDDSFIGSAGGGGNTHAGQQSITMYKRNGANYSSVVLPISTGHAPLCTKFSRDGSYFAVGSDNNDPLLDLLFIRILVGYSLCAL